MHLNITQRRHIAALRKSIKHWNRMIRYVKKLAKRNPDFRMTPGNMRRNIGEDWFAKSCPLCQLYRDPVTTRLNCDVCGLACENENRPWVTVYNAHGVVSVWLERAIVMRDFLKKCLEEELE